MGYPITDTIKAFNSTSRYVDDILNNDFPYFGGMVNQIYPPELQYNKTNTIDTEGSLFGFTSIDIYLCLTVLFPPKFMIATMILVLIW